TRGARSTQCQETSSVQAVHTGSCLHTRTVHPPRRFNACEPGGGTLFVRGIVWGNEARRFFAHTKRRALPATRCAHCTASAGTGHGGNDVSCSGCGIDAFNPARAPRRASLRDVARFTMTSLLPLPIGHAHDRSRRHLAFRDILRRERAADLADPRRWPVMT